MKKLKSILFSLVFLLSFLVPFALGSETKADDVKTTVNVHKILMSKEKMDSHNSDKKYDPLTGITNIADFFGDTGAKEIANVYFVAVKTGDNTSGILKDGTLDESRIDEYVRAKTGEGLVVAGLTQANGLGLTLNDGDWVIYEVKSKSTYVGAGKELLAEQKAVPVRITLPYISSNGRASAINVYPKNTQDKPNIDKFVGEENNKKLSAGIGEEVEWLITSTLPSNISDYKKYTFTDALPNTLQYVANSLTITLDGAVYQNANATITEPSDSNSNTLTVSFNNHMANLSSAGGKKLVIKFKTRIKDTATMNTDIVNNASLNYSHSPNVDGETITLPEDPTDPPGGDPNRPRVYTGGKKFVKVDSVTETKTLSGAEFLVKNGDGKYLVRKDGVSSWVEADSIDAAKQIDGIVKLTSGGNGEFEITGLKYGNKEGVGGAGSTTYKLVEIKAPDGYALMGSDISFTVDKDSYNGADAVLKVKNTTITIPQTGGIGTVVFTVVGLSLITISVIAIRRKKAR